MEVLRFDFNGLSGESKLTPQEFLRVNPLPKASNFKNKNKEISEKNYMFFKVRENA